MHYRNRFTRFSYPYTVSNDRLDYHNSTCIQLHTVNVTRLWCAPFCHYKQIILYFGLLHISIWIYLEYRI